MNTLLFKYEQSKAIQLSKVKLEHFKQDIGAFQGFDNDLDNNFAVDWKDANDLSESQKPDSTVRAQQKQETDKIKHQTDFCIKGAKDAKYYLGLAFPDDDSYLTEFGFHKIHKERNSTARFIVWMFTLHNRADKYKNELTAAGMPQTKIDNLLSLANNLLTAERDQEAFKRERISITRVRTSAFNFMWRFVLRIVRVAEIIFDDDEATLNKFKLPQLKKAKDKNADSETTTES